jgi:hypothetical protein
MLVLGIVQVVVVVRDQLAVELAAREAARAASVAAAPGSAASRAANAAISLRPLDVAATTSWNRVTVTVAYQNDTSVPLIGALIEGVELRATVTMQREPP